VLAISFAESAGLQSLLVHLLCLSLLVGRALHAFGVSQIDDRFGLRVSAMILTFSSLHEKVSSVPERGISRVAPNPAPRIFLDVR
jgi:uncharacterized membrane protein YecN with MAPEG domain